MICPACQTANEADRKFCSECGAGLASVCPSCGMRNSAASKFCGECGAALTTAEPRRLSVAAADTQPLVATVERRLVSVLFADLVGFTRLAEDRDAEDTRALLSAYFDSARQVIDRYGGTVEKFIGDAVMAVWGTPTAHEDDAERAVRAGLELVQAVNGLGVQLGADLAIRAGILTGEVAVTLGAEGEGMVAGDLVNTASRLQSVAPAGTVLVGETTYRAAGDAIAFEPLGDQQLKGKELPVPAWRALRVVARRGGAGRAEALEAPFVGRAEELLLLKELLHITGREQRPRLVSITGAAGIGKSRLAWELLKYTDGLVEDIYWHEGRSPAYGEGVTFWALGEMIRQRAGIAEIDAADVAREKLQAAVSQYVADEEERSWIQPALAGLLGLEELPSVERERLFSAWRTFVERVAEHGTTVLVFEDLQWADAGLLDFIEHLLEWSRSRPILVVTLARPELLDVRQTWGLRQRSFSALHLEPLAPEFMRSLVEGVAPGVPQPLVERIVDRAGGVPLYAVELVRMLVADGRLVADDGRFRAVDAIDQLSVPPSLQALLAARLDALDPADRALLQTAAVLGQVFRVAAIVEVSGLDAMSVEAALERMVRNELIALEADPGSPERGQYRFLQSPTREVAAGMLARRERHARHLAAARYYEQLGDPELAGVLANHYLEAYRAAQAGTEADALATHARVALTAAADRAAALHSHEQTLAYAEQALSISVDDTERAALWERAGEASVSLARGEQSAEYLRRALAVRQAGADTEAIARVTWRLGRVLINSGQPERGLELLERAVAERSEDQPAYAQVFAELARGYLMANRSGESILDVVDRALSIAERFELMPVIVQAFITKGLVLGLDLGRQQEGIALLQAADELAAAAGDVLARVRVLGNLPNLQLPDDPHAARRSGEAGLSEALRIGAGGQMTFLPGNTMEAMFVTGAWDDALRLGAEFSVETIGARHYIPILSVTSKVAALRGDRDRAASELEEMMELLRGITEPQISVIGPNTEALHAFAAGRFDEALRLALEGIRVTAGDAYAGAVLAARCAFWLVDERGHNAAATAFGEVQVRGRMIAAMRRDIEAGALALSGRRDAAVAAFREATRRWQELDLPLDLALAQLALAAAVGPETDDGATARAAALDVMERLGAGSLAGLIEERLTDTARAFASGAAT